MLTGGLSQEFFSSKKASFKIKKLKKCWRPPTDFAIVKELNNLFIYFILCSIFGSIILF